MARKVPQFHWKDCPECGRPMVRYGSLRRHQERIWVMWKPDEWKLPWHFIIFGFLLLATFPAGMLGLGLVRGSGKLIFYFINSLGVVAMTVWGYLDYRARLRKREKFKLTLKDGDWVCPSCLRSYPENPKTVENTSP